MINTVMMGVVMMGVVDEKTEVQKGDVTSPGNIVSWWQNLGWNLIS